MPIDGNEPIDRLEVEAAAVSDALFGPLVASWGVAAELALIDSNVALPWITSGLAQRDDVDPILAGFWAQMAFRAALNGLKGFPAFPTLRMRLRGACHLSSRVDGGVLKSRTYSGGSRMGTAFGRAGLGGGDRLFLLGLHGMHFHLGAVRSGRGLPASRGRAFARASGLGVGAASGGGPRAVMAHPGGPQPS